MPSLGLNRLSSPRHAAAPTIAKSPVYDRAVELTKYYRSVLPSIESLWDDEEGNISPRESQQQRTPRRPKSPCALPLTRDDTDSSWEGSPNAPPAPASDPTRKPPSCTEQQQTCAQKPAHSRLKITPTMLTHHGARAPIPGWGRACEHVGCPSFAPLSQSSMAVLCSN
jgi:hypothetical protein